MSDSVTEEDCTTRQGVLHGRINERAPWKLILWVLFIFFMLIVGSYGYTSTSMNKVETRQWEFSEKMITKEDLTDFKTEIRSDLDKINLSIESLRR